ncbi:hypothetical protein MMC22_000936 [Lobaria immixta]|nr:hypothetical protein [Lobaria immixta]
MSRSGREFNGQANIRSAAMAVSRISELASIIAAMTAEFDAHITAEGLPSPSFHPSSPPDLLLHPNIAAARQKILEATDELHALMLGPVGILTSSIQIKQHNSLISLQAIYRFGLATSLPAGSKETSFAEIASMSGVEEQMVRRILRHAAAQHIFQEPRNGFIAHTAASQVLAVNSEMRQWTVDALTKWRDSREPTHTGYNLAHQTDLTIFEEISNDSQRAQRYADAMTWFSTGPGFEITHLLENFPWQSLGTGIVVDIGGGYGSVSIALAQRFNSLRCIVQDRSEVVAGAQARLPPNLAGRVTFMEHDFFTNQPIKNAAVFFLRWILHDWSDKHAIRILRSLIPALAAGTRVLVNEYILPEPGVVSFYREKLFRNFDMSMLEIHNGKERGLEDWKQLFGDADRRFALLGVHQPRLSRLAMIEFVWDPDGTWKKYGDSSSPLS